MATGSQSMTNSKCSRWLQIIYGKADKARRNIDAALHNDDIFRRRRVMRSLAVPTHFPQPQNMKDSSNSTMGDMDTG